jgi:hypothetical protein
MMRTIARFVINFGTMILAMATTANAILCFECPPTIEGFVSFAVIEVIIASAVYLFWLWLFDELEI